MGLNGTHPLVSILGFFSVDLSYVTTQSGLVESTDVKPGIWGADLEVILRIWAVLM